MGRNGARRIPAEGVLELYHTIRVGKGFMGVHATTTYSLESLGNGTVRLSLCYYGPDYFRVQDVDPRYASAVVEIFDKELRRIFWNKAADQLFGQVIEKVYENPSSR